jgi:hypothetical protein
MKWPICLGHDCSGVTVPAKKKSVDLLGFADDLFYHVLSKIFPSLGSRRHARLGRRGLPPSLRRSWIPSLSVGAFRLRCFFLLGSNNLGHVQDWFLISNLWGGLGGLGIFACQVPRFLAISLHSFQHGHGAGVAYCHAKGVMHKDLKLENIMPLDFIGPGRGYGCYEWTPLVEN